MRNLSQIRAFRRSYTVSKNNRDVVKTRFGSVTVFSRRALCLRHKYILYEPLYYYFFIFFSIFRRNSVFVTFSRVFKNLSTISMCYAFTWTTCAIIVEFRAIRRSLQTATGPGDKTRHFYISPVQRSSNSYNSPALVFAM